MSNFVTRDGLDSTNNTSIHYKVMSKDYNKYSKIQLAAILKMLDILFENIFIDKLDLLQLFDQVSLPSGERSYSFQISDYGCSSGKNSIFIMKSLYYYLQQVISKDDSSSPSSSLNFHAFLLDLPTNDFNKIFQVYQDEEKAEGILPNFYLSTGAGNLYKQSLPPQSVHLSCSFSALHWLSMPFPRYGKLSNPACCYISSADPLKDSEVIKKLIHHSMKDFENYFLARRNEVKVGGLIFFTCLGYDTNLFPTLKEEEEFIAGKSKYKILPCIHRTGRLLGHILFETRKHFNLPENGGGDLFMLPMIPHRTEDVVEVIANNPDLQSSYEVLYNEIYDVGDAYSREGLSEEVLLAQRCGSTRGYSESSIKELLCFNQEAVEWFYEKLLQTMKEDRRYIAHDTGMLMTVVRRIR